MICNQIIKVFEEEHIIGITDYDRERINIKLIVNSINDNSGILLLKLVISNNISNVILLEKLLKHTVPIGKEQEISILFNVNLINNFNDLINHIINNIKPHRDRLAKQVISLLKQQDTIPICTQDTNKHVWNTIEIFPSGNFKHRICILCGTDEKIGCYI